MSPTASNPVLDSSGHPPAETVAEYLEELLPPEATAQLRAHFTECADCADTLAALEEISSLLGRTETPVLPADIAVRIDAALAAEARRPGPVETPSTSAPSTTSGSTTAAARKSHSAPSAPGRGPTAPTGPGQARDRARRWRRAVLGTAALAVVGLVVGTAVLGGGDDTHSSASKSSGAAAGARAQALPKAPDAPVALTDANLADQVRQLVGPTVYSAKSPLTAGNEPGSLAATSPAGTPVPASADTPPCVLAAADRGDQAPVALARGSYRDTPVFLLVYPDAAGTPGTLDAYVVAASCSPSGGLLQHRTVAGG